MAAATFALWALVAASAVYWGLKLATRPAPVSAMPPAVRAPVPVDPMAVARLMGATQAAAAPLPSLASRFSLVGVVANRSNQGAALITVDGKPPKPFRVGAAVDEGLVLKAVEPRRAILAASADGAPVLTLDLPPRK